MQLLNAAAPHIKRVLKKAQVKYTKANNAISPQVVRDYMEYMETNKSISPKMVRDCMKYMKSNKFISPQVVRD